MFEFLFNFLTLFSLAEQSSAKLFSFSPFIQNSIMDVEKKKRTIQF